MSGTAAAPGPRRLGDLTIDDLDHAIRFTGGPWRVIGSVRHYRLPDRTAHTSVVHRDQSAKPTDPWRETNAPSDTPCEVSG